ncbi:MAG: hypothetical protein FJX57_24480 [Alphaproteobacteria bacterium]|nr:hypothetical protein [Alphaproteobacteria bacterium]
MSEEQAPAKAKAPAAAAEARQGPDARRRLIRATSWLLLSLLFTTMVSHGSATQRPPGHLTLDIGNFSTGALAVRTITVDGIEARQTGRTLQPRGSGAAMSEWRLTAADLPLPPPGQAAMVVLHLLDPANGHVRIEQFALPERVAGQRCQVTVVLRREGVGLSSCLDPRRERLSA